MKRLTILLVMLAVAVVGCSNLEAEEQNPDEEVLDLNAYFGNYDGAFVLYDQATDEYLRYQPERCAERFLPASTFKILNALIGLETGVIPDKDHVIAWDDSEYPYPNWSEDNDLQSAIHYSVVWYFQELARRVGAERMQQYVSEVGYGNSDITGNIDSFWLDGALRISADEQVEFLKRLYTDDLPFSSHSLDTVKDILVLEEGEGYRFSGKTGSVQRVTPHTGWFVGTVEIDDHSVFFATNFETRDPDGFANGATAEQITRDVLRGLGYIP